MIEKFDNTKPNVIILSDFGNFLGIQKTLGPYKIAHTLRQEGIEVVVLHHLHIFTVDEILHFLKHLVSDQTLFIGVSNYFYWNPEKLLHINDKEFNLTFRDSGSFIPHGAQYNEKIKSLVKEINPDCKFVVGGPDASDSEFNKDFDFVCLGFGEISMVNLTKFLLKEEPLRDFTRSIWGFKVLTNAKAEGYDFSESTMSYVEYDGVLRNDVLIIEIARGCIFKCAFCAYPLNGKKKLDYIRSKENIKKELLENYYRYNVTSYVFGDDTLNDSVEKCKMLYEISKELPFKLKYKAYIRLDLLAAHPETIEYLFDGGLVAAHFGIETLNKKTASTIGKGGSREKLTKTMNYIKEKYGDTVTLYGTFIFGLPYESLESMKQTEEWLVSEDCPLDSFNTFPLSIAPLTNKIGSRGFLSDIDLNYEKYGYVNQGVVYLGEDVEGMTEHTQKLARVLNWKNEETDYKTVLQMTDKFNSEIVKKGDMKVKVDDAFILASLGVPVKHFINAKYNSLNLSGLDLLKMKRATDYKNKMYSSLQVPFIKDSSPTDLLKKYKVFSNFLLDNAKEFVYNNNN